MHTSCLSHKGLWTPKMFFGPKKCYEGTDLGTNILKPPFHKAAPNAVHICIRPTFANSNTQLHSTRCNSTPIDNFIYKRSSMLQLSYLLVSKNYKNKAKKN